MRRIEIEHEIAVTPQQFWETFLDRDYITTLHREGLSFPKFEVLEQSQTDTKVLRTLRYTPKMNMPKAVTKVLGDISFEQDDTFDRQPGVLRWTLRPSHMADRMREAGTIQCDAVGDNRCRRRVTIELEAKIFGVGRLIETNAESMHREIWDARARFTRQWVTR